MTMMMLGRKMVIMMGKTRRLQCNSDYDHDGDGDCECFLQLLTGTTMVESPWDLFRYELEVWYGYKKDGNNEDYGESIKMKS